LRNEAREKVTVDAKWIDNFLKQDISFAGSSTNSLVFYCLAPDLYPQMLQAEAVLEAKQ
jgi:hypothetical protein